jgi:hypothetical protein
VFDVFVLDVIHRLLGALERLGHLLAVVDRNVEILVAVEQEYGGLNLRRPLQRRAVFDHFRIATDRLLNTFSVHEMPIIFDQRLRIGHSRDAHETAVTVGFLDTAHQRRIAPIAPPYSAAFSPFSGGTGCL